MPGQEKGRWEKIRSLTMVRPIKKGRKNIRYRHWTTIQRKNKDWNRMGWKRRKNTTRFFSALGPVATHQLARSE